SRYGTAGEAVERGHGGSPSSLTSRGWGDRLMSELTRPIGKLIHDKAARDAVIRSAEILATATGGSGLLTSGLSKLGAVGRALTSWKTPVLTGIGSLGIGEFRQNNPTIDPRTDHYLALGQQILGYTSAITGLGAAKKNVGSALDRLEVTTNFGGTSKVYSGSEALAASFQSLGDKMNALGRAVGNKLPSAITKPMDWLYRAYTSVADFTGSSLKELADMPQAAGKLRLSREMSRQAKAISETAGALSEAQKAAASDVLFKAHQSSLAGDARLARSLYDEGAGLWYEIDRALGSSGNAASKLMEEAARLSKDAKMTLLKGAYVAVGFGAKEAYDEHRIRSTQQEMERAFEEGRSYSLPAVAPRSTVGTALATAAGTLGNPIEKQFRFGQDKYLASVAAYRAQYDAIGSAEQSGELSAAEAQTERDRPARYKPKNMAGKAAWTFAPASAAFLSWKVNDAVAAIKQPSRVERVARVLDGDTVQLESGRTVRMMGVDTPESVHPTKPSEYLGPEASAELKKRLTGKYVRVVESPGASTDKYGRGLGYLETLPGPFHRALAVPGLNKLLPAVDQNKKMIELGYGQPRYLELSGGHARQIEYDKATARAIARGVGVHSPAGLEQLDYHYKPWDQKKREEASRLGFTLPDEGPSSLATPLGIGLMTTGQSGVFKHMGGSGNVAAQSWNALLAVLGAREFNQQAAQNPVPKTYRRVKALKTERERRAEEVLARRRVK
ncbi:MAG TPA: thermonuclease family protein, partial [Kiritimatiellia bacterium]|nr:thermonuclease family protein [Kiritimatiellia bacterium]